MPDKTTDKATDKAINRVGDIRKALADPTPLYFAAGVIDKIREVAPERIAAVKAADPKAMQQRVTQQAKHTQSRLSSALAGIDTDIKKLRDQAQHLALQGVGLAAEYAVKAREGYDELAERGRGVVQSRRAEKNGDGRTTLEETRERDEILVFEPESEAEIKARIKEEQAGTGTRTRGRAARSGAAKKAESGSARKSTARKTTARESAAKKTASKSTAKATPKTAEKAAEKTAAKSTEKTAAKPASRTASQQDKPQS